ncbi:type II secretion system secretin GspD [Pontibacterium granulatum]|uniref:type II secretion system secretin GspD n=1 Tax=Pontibacterium granulatum TaxID=2036029 RepID=UPI002499B797|nr:type II secretion system secretin GspD [Pontibacterium granulatum]MDI3324159.1 type II secretion system secretin GspD [Pontibacterium granulatum]
MELKRIFGFIALTSVCALVSSCSLTPGGDRDTFDSPWKKKTAQQIESSGDSQATAEVAQPAISDAADRFKDQYRTTEINEAPSQEFYQGTGSMVNLGVASRDAIEPGEGDITLNFQDAEIGEVVKTILGDILQKNYVLDEDVRGSVYLQTSRPLSSDELIPTLETLLQFNDAVLLKSQNFYEIVPAAKAPVAFVPRTRLRAGSGYQVLILPLRYIASSEMMKILEPLKPEKGLIEVDERRNLLTVAGTEEELTNIRETVRIFDVDQLKGMSVGLFRLQSVEAGVIVEELEAIFGDSADGPLAGLVRFMPIERLNALLVMTPQKKYLTDVKVWISRLDRAEDRRGMNMYVYYVQNGKAENLSEMLGELFEGQRRSQRRQQDSRDEQARTQTTRNESSDTAGSETSSTDTSSRTKVSSSNNDGSSLDVGDVSIIADEENNALLILASPIDYEKVRDAIEKLDVLPLQVLVEATIVEVSLQDELRYGLQWFFKSSLDNKSARGSVGNVPIVTPNDFFPTANFEVFDAVGTRLLLNALAEDSKLNVISSPSLMVLDNHTATIRVGDQVPVRTSETTATTSDNLNTTSTIQFKDTGVLLEVTPRVNAGGMVVLDIKQEVNDVDQTTTSGIDSPTIIQRQIETSVAVQSGETLVLGGLIKENRDQSSGGVPGVRHVPVLGWLFGSERKFVDRTELVVMITPTAVTDKNEARDVTREYRDKLRGVEFPEG